MQTKQLFELKRYLNILAYRKDLILSGILLGITCGLIFYIAQPKIYQSESLLSYPQQKINLSQTSQGEQAGLGEIINTLIPIVMNSSSLEKIILKEDLYSERRQDLPIEDIVETMRANTDIVYSRHDDTLVIKHKGHEPRNVARVTNALSARFVEENARYRENRGSELTAHNYSALDMAKEMLGKAEAVMRDYELKYYKEMPDQKSINISRLNALKKQYQGKQESIQEFKQSLMLIQDQIHVQKEIVDETQQQMGLQTGSEQGKTTVINFNQNATLKMLQNGLEDLQDRYTDQHPQVKRLKKEIANLEQLIAEEERGKKGYSASVNQGQQYGDKSLSLQSQIEDVSPHINKLEREKEEIGTLIKKYEEWLASVPIRRAEWSSLTRVYGELKRHYDFLVTENLQAHSALNLESKLKNSQLIIEDPAHVPESPINSKFRKIMVIAMFAGLIASGTLAVGLGLFDTTFKSQVEVEQEFDLPVICSIPSFVLSGEVARERFKSFSKTAFFLVWISAICLALLDLKSDSQIMDHFVKLIR